MSSVNDFFHIITGRPTRASVWTREDEFHDTCGRGNEEQLATFLEDPKCLAVINEPNYHDGTTPLEVAYSRNNIRAMEMLIEHGADVNKKDWNECTLLHRACKSNNVEMIKFLVLKGADVTAVDKNGLTPDQLTHLDVKSFWYETANETNRLTSLFIQLLPLVHETPETPEASSSTGPSTGPDTCHIQ